MPPTQPSSLVSTAMYPWQDIVAIVVHAERQAICSWPQPLLPALALTITCVSTVDICHYTCTCRWTPQLGECILPALVTNSAYPGPSCWIWWCCWGPQQPAQPQWTPHSHHIGPQSCECCGPQWSKSKRHHASPEHSAATSPLTWHPANPEILPPRAESFLLPKSVYKVWKTWFLYKMHRHLCEAVGIMKNQGNSSTKGTQ